MKRRISKISVVIFSISVTIGLLIAFFGLFCHLWGIIVPLEAILFKICGTSIIIAVLFGIIAFVTDD